MLACTTFQSSPRHFSSRETFSQRTIFALEPSLRRLYYTSSVYVDNLYFCSLLSYIWVSAKRCLCCFVLQLPFACMLSYYSLVYCYCAQTTIFAFAFANLSIAFHFILSFYCLHKLLPVHFYWIWLQTVAKTELCQTPTTSTIRME